MDIKKEMEALLYNFWITKDENQELYYKIKANQNRLKDFIIKNLGSNLIIHDRFIKLEKVPTLPKKNTGIETFTSNLDYVILMIILIFLEDKARGDRFVLSDLVEYIKNTAVTLELDNIPDWNLISHRRSFSNAMKFLIDISAIKIKDEEKISFTESKDADALYESMGISNYIMRLFDNEIYNITEPKEFLRNEFLTQNEEKGDIRRYKVFRNILFTPSVFMAELTPNEIDYIRKNRLYIKNEIENNLELDTEITYNTAIVFDDVNSTEKDNFPNNKKISEVVLMVNAKILEDINNNVLTYDDYEVITVNESYLENIIREIKTDKKPYLSKYYKDLSNEKFYEEILEYMISYNFVNKVNDKIIIYPSIAKMIGITKEINENTQIDLFGGSYEEL